MTATCRSCSARIRWALTPRGKRIPIDADPRPDGNLALYVDVGLDVVAVHVEPGQLLADDDGTRYVSHFATCPNADQHRQERTG